MRDSQTHGQRTHYTDTLEPAVQRPSVQKAKRFETVYDSGQIKKWCKLVMGVKGKSVKQMKVKRILRLFPPVVKSVCLHEWL